MVNGTTVYVYQRKHKERTSIEIKLIHWHKSRNADDINITSYVPYTHITFKRSKRRDLITFKDRNKIGEEIIQIGDDII